MLLGIQNLEFAVVILLEFISLCGIAYGLTIHGKCHCVQTLFQMRTVILLSQTDCYH